MSDKNGSRISIGLRRIGQRFTRANSNLPTGNTVSEQFQNIQQTAQAEAVQQNSNQQNSKSSLNAPSAPQPELTEESSSESGDSRVSMYDFEVQTEPYLYDFEVQTDPYFEEDEFGNVTVPEQSFNNTQNNTTSRLYPNLLNVEAEINRQLHDFECTYNPQKAEYTLDTIFAHCKEIDERLAKYKVPLDKVVLPAQLKPFIDCLYYNSLDISQFPSLKNCLLQEAGCLPDKPSDEFIQSVQSELAQLQLENESLTDRPLIELQGDNSCEKTPKKPKRKGVLTTPNSDTSVSGLQTSDNTDSIESTTEETTGCDSSSSSDNISSIASLVWNAARRTVTQLIYGTEHMVIPPQQQTVAVGLRNRQVPPPPPPPNRQGNPNNPNNQQPQPNRVARRQRAQNMAQGNLNNQQRRNADPAMLAILDRMTGDRRLIMFPKKTFSGKEKDYTSRDHWDEFQKYYNFQNADRPFDIADVSTYFGNTLAGDAYQWHQDDLGDVADVATLKQKFLQRFNPWGQTTKEWTKAWHALSFNSTKSTVEKFKREVQLLGKMLNMTDPQILDKYKEAFPAYIESQLVGLDTLQAAHTKAKTLVQIYKSELESAGATASPTSSVLVHTAPNTNPKTGKDKSDQDTMDHGQYSRPRKQGSSNQRGKQFDRSSGGRKDQNFKPQQRRQEQSNTQFSQQRPQNQNQRFNNNNRGNFYSQPRGGFQRGRGRGYRGGRGLPMYQSQNNYGNVPYGQQQRPYYPNNNPQNQFANDVQQSYKGIPQARWVCNLCANRGHYDHQCQFAQDFMTRTARAFGYNPRQFAHNNYDHDNQQGGNATNHPAIEDAPDEEDQPF